MAKILEIQVIMTNKKIKKAYSIGEALITMLIIALVFIAVTPSLSKKKIHLNSLFRIKHGVYTCKGESCTFNLPDGVKDIFVIATSGGGGGAGTYCGSSTYTISGGVGGDVSGTIAAHGMAHIAALAGGGASCQGCCDAYPYGEFNPELHKKRCNIYPNATYEVEEEVNGQREKVTHQVYCDFNGSSRPSECDNAALGDSQEGSAVCSKTWVLKPEVGMPKRGCNVAVFGRAGAGGSSTNASICLNRNTCLEYTSQGECKLEETPASIPYTIGGAGKKSGGSGNPLTLGSYLNLAGGVGCGGGVAPSGNGGGHIGMSGAYSTLPVPNTQDGGVGFMTITEKFIEWGSGGYSGVTKSGYFKNVEGPIVIISGKGGSGGKNGGSGRSGEKTIVKAKKGGFAIDTKNTYTGNNLIDGGSGILLEIEGGLGGTLHRHYESCSNNFFGTLTGEESTNHYSNGGDGGAAGQIPDCPSTSGEDGKDGMVIIFY